MKIRWLALLTLIGKLFADRNEITKDYFVYKNVPSVVAFLCNSNATNNLHLAKILNEEKISVAILYPELKFSFEKVMKVKYSRFGVLLDLNCANWYSNFILKESSKFKTYNDSYNWLLLGNNLNETIRMLNDDTFSIDTDLVIAVKTAANDGYHLHDVYNHGKEREGKLNVTEFATWNNDSGLNVTLVQAKYRRRGNFHGMKLKVISVTQYRPDDVRVQDHLEDHSKRQLDTMSKYGYAILSHVADIFNFTLEVVETSFWDQISSDGVHLGMVGMLHRNEADLGATPAVMTTERATLTHLIGAVWPFRTCFMFRSMTSRVNNEFLRPFTPESWTLTGVMVAICVISLGLTFKVEFFQERLNAWNEAVLVTMGIMCQQGSMLTPRSLSSRIVIMHLLIFSLLIYNYYSASVVSTQLNMPIDKMNDSLHELTKSNLAVGAEPITYMNFGLTSINDWEVKEFYVKRWKPFAEEMLFVPLEEGFARVAKGGFAYHTDPNTGYPYVERLFTDEMICQLTEVHLFKPQRMAMWGKLDSPFNKITRIGLTKLSSAGILTRLKKRWESRKPVCLRESFSVQSVSILTTAPAFMILCIGILFALSICILENLIAKISP